MSRALISKDTKTWTMLYKTYIRSILEYGITAYCPFLKGQLAKLESVQKWATIQIRGIGRYSYEKRKSICHLPSIEERMDRGIALEVFKLQNNISGISANRFTSIEPKYTLRSISSLNYYQGYAKTEKRKTALVFKAHKLWQNIPLEKNVY